MIKRAILPAILILGMLMTVGVAVAAIGSNDDSSSSTALTANSSGTTSINAQGDDDGSTSTTTRDTDDDDRTTSTSPLRSDDDRSTTMGGDDDNDDEDDDNRTTSTTTPGSDDSSDSSTAASGPIVVDAAPAGSITVALADGRLTLVSTDIASTWTRTREEINSDEIKLKYDNGSTELEIEVELEDGRVKWHVTFEPHRSATSTTSTTSTTMPDGDDSSDSSTAAASGPIVVDAAPAGSVTVAVSDGRLTLVTTDIASTWTKIRQEIESDQIKLKYDNGSTELEIEVELEDGRVTWHVTFEPHDS